jgi:hypothetical protein|tara:strand:- start:1547 stop:1765 length:219 start_codon:yes stop_codon:yes gene_type:complete
MEDLIFTCTIEDEVMFTMKPIPDFEGAWDFDDIAEFVTNMTFVSPDCRRKISLQCRAAGWLLIGIKVTGEGE